MFDTILIANRGEIALRVIRTCRDMGIRTVAVYSDVDESALHVINADAAVHIGPAAPSESYLNVVKLMAACKESGAQALHPGYGFLSEQAVLARACADHGITFIGPPPEAMELLGSKRASRRMCVESGLPVSPGAESDAWTPESLRAEAEKLGYPILLKASAGGGGKGMRAVAGPDTLVEDYEGAVREAQSAFGDGTVYMEKLLQSPRHIEFQILADQHGHCIHLNERECSIQRRHQKIIEETPSSVVSPELRARMGEVAVNAAQAAGYTNAGTVEFLLDAEGNFYFLEMNARLQVEHPITEMVTGIDLVRQQILVAAGEPLTLTQDDVVARGHAIECRIYAEDPEENFMPSPGKILSLHEPRGPGIRCDSGVYSGYTVPMDYDPILAKLVAHGEDRETARRRMVSALKSYVVLGIKTPVEYLRAILEHPAFVACETPNDFIPTHFAGWRASGDYALEALALAAMAARLAPAVPAGRADGAAAGPPSPWETLGAWRASA